MGFSEDYGRYLETAGINPGTRSDLQREQASMLAIMNQYAIQGLVKIGPGNMWVPNDEPQPIIDLQEISPLSYGLPPVPAPSSIGLPVVPPDVPSTYPNPFRAPIGTMPLSPPIWQEWPNADKTPADVEMMDAGLEPSPLPDSGVSPLLVVGGLLLLYWIWKG